MFAVCHESFTFSSPKYRSAVSASGGLFCQITVIRRTGKMDKYDLQFGKIHPSIWINTFGKLDKYSGFFSFCLITVIGRYPIPKAFVRVKMDKYILQFGQIHFKIWINTSVFSSTAWSPSSGDIQFPKLLSESRWTGKLCQKVTSSKSLALKVDEVIFLTQVPHFITGSKFATYHQLISLYINEDKSARFTNMFPWIWYDRIGDERCYKIFSLVPL